jgi:FAD-dependent urate hydroxylase
VAEVAIIGAGPQGLAVASALRHEGVDTVVFGEVMGFWKEHMPKGMLLRSSKRSSSIADPDRDRTTFDYERETGPLPEPLPIERFIDYCEWYQRREVPDVVAEHVTSVERVGDEFRLRVNGDETMAKRVVVAAGMAPFAWRPPEFADLSPEHASHPFDHKDLAVFKGKRAFVVGAGQSALESAALMHEAGAEVEVVARAGRVTWISPPAERPTRMQRIQNKLSFPPTDVGSRGISWIAASPDVFRRMPDGLQREVQYDVIRPMGGFWLRHRMDDVPIHLKRRIVSARPANGSLDVELDDGTRREVDHILFATGYRVDVSGYDFLSRDLVAQLDVADGYPVLRTGLEASVPGLHFVGAPAAGTFGPVMRFVTGSWYAAPALARRVLGRSPRPVVWSF